MDLTALRSLADASTDRLPGSARALLKRMYQRGTQRQPVDVMRTVTRSPGAATSRNTTLRLVRAGELGYQLGAIACLAAARTGIDSSQPHVCLVAPGALDDRLEDLLACEHSGTPIVCLIHQESDLHAETAGIASGLLLSTPQLLQAAASVLPTERLAVAPTLLPASSLRPAGLNDGPRRDLLVAGPQAPSAGNDLGGTLHVRRVAATPDVEELMDLAGSALAVAVPSEADANGILCTAALALCGVPPVGHVEAHHPLAGLVAAVEPSDSGSPATSLSAWHADPERRRIAGIRSRRYALQQLTTSAALVQLLPKLGQPVHADGVIGVVPITDPLHLARAKSNLARLSGLRAAVIVDRTDGRQLARAGLADLHLDVQVVRPGSAVPRALRGSPGRYVAVLDERSWYGPDHVRDLLLARAATGCTIVGRRAHHRVVSPGCVEPVDGPEEAVVDHLLPGSSLLPKALAATVLRQVTAAEERRLQREATERGAHLYAIHRYGWLADVPVATRRIDDALRSAFPEGDGGIPFDDGK